MADNTGNYITQGELISELANAGRGSASVINLTAKAATTLPEHTFTFSSSGVPVIGDWLVQGSEASDIVAVAGSVITVRDATNINNGSAKFVNFNPPLLASDLDKLIEEAMDFIDLATRQWFNKRDLTLRFEGNNTEITFLGVPVIEVTSINLNGRDLFTSTIADHFEVFSGRTYPDERRNPRIKLMRNIQEPNIFALSQGRSWLRGRMSTVVGSFGFLEPDGSTPSLIKRATTKLAVMRELRSVGLWAKDAVTSTDKGPIKREVTDMHEVEYYNPGNTDGKTAGQNVGTGLSGDDEIDDIIAMYRAPIFLGHSFNDYGKESPVFYNGF